MKNYARIALLSILSIGLLMSSAHAQPMKPPPLPRVPKLDMTKGPLKAPFKRIENLKVGKKSETKKKKKGKRPKKDKPDFSGPVAPDYANPAATRKSPPGGPSPKVPRWRADDDKKDKKDETPELNTDFLENCARLKPGVKVSLDIYDEDLEAVVKLIACMTGENIILAKPLKGKKITIYSPTKVTAKEAKRAFMTALETNGFTISKQGKFLRIIAIKDFARASDPLIGEDRDPPNVDQMVTQILQLKHVDAGEINEVLSKMASKNAQFIVYAPNNSLIVTELGSNLRKLKRLIEQLDVPGGKEQLWVYQVVHAEASDIAQKILEIFEKDGGSGSSKKKKRKKGKKKRGKKASTSSVGESDLDATVNKVMADERTNRLLIVATRRSYRSIKRLIKELDTPVEGDGQVHIHQLNHAKAGDLASVLSSLSQSQRSGTSKRRKSKKKKKSKSRSSKGSTSAALFEGEVNVTADEDTNALVITASFKDYLSLKSVIEALDRPRRQVFIEAVIMEVKVTNSREFGVGSHFGSLFKIGGEDSKIAVNNQRVSGAASFGADPTAFLASAASITGIAMAGPDLDLGNGIQIPAFGAILKALATNDDINVLSTPHILTTDNEEAEIVVGDNVPFATSISGMGGLGGLSGASGLGGFGFPSVNVQRQDVALTLKITPRINAANFVTLEIDQVVEELGARDEETKQFSTSKRSVKSTVVVKDQNTVVIGGLQKSKQTNSQAAFPVLGEVPIIGHLFRSSSSQRERVNLLLMLTPHVIEGPEDFNSIIRRKMDELRGSTRA